MTRFLNSFDSMISWTDFCGSRSVVTTTFVMCEPPRGTRGSGSYSTDFCVLARGGVANLARRIDADQLDACFWPLCAHILRCDTASPDRFASGRAGTKPCLAREAVSAP